MMIRELLTHNWPFWLGGIAIGSFVVLLAWVTGKGLGVSTGYGSVCSLISGLSFFQAKPYTERWRLWFVAGIPLGGFLSIALSGDVTPKLHVGIFESLYGESLLVKAAVLMSGGFLIGFGARWAGG